MLKKGFKISIEYKKEYILLSEFSNYKNNTLTTEEELTEEENSKYSLNFKIFEEVGGSKTLTPETFNLKDYLKIGRKIKLELLDSEDSVYETIYLIISSISPEGHSDNIAWNISATDLFSFIFSKNNTELVLDTIESESFLEWMERTKVTEEGIEFNSNLDRLSLFRVGTVKDIAEYILQRGHLRKEYDESDSDYDNLLQWRIAFEGEESKSQDELIINDPSNQKVNISLSGSNTYNALVELTFLSNSLLHIDYDSKTIRFRDRGSDFFKKNYTLSPDFNLQELNLNYNSDSFFPLFFITGGEDDFGLSIGIVPSLSYSQYKIIKYNLDLIKNPGTTLLVAEEISNKYNINLIPVQDNTKKFLINFGGNGFPSDFFMNDSETVYFKENLLSSSIEIESSEQIESFKNILNSVLEYEKGSGTVTLKNEKGELLFSKNISEGLYQEYFNLYIEFNADIEVSSYSNILGEAGYYNSIFSSFNANGIDEKTLNTINFIPYLDTFILNLDYFLNNNFLDSSQILEIKNRIYNDLRYINLDYQIAIFNKHTIEGSIREKEDLILNYADQLAGGTEKNYVEINNELEKIFFRESGSQNIGLPYNMGGTILDENYDIVMPIGKNQKFYRELMSNGFFFYPISSLDFTFLETEGWSRWDGESPIQRKELYQYNVSGEDYFLASGSISTKYPMWVILKINNGDFQKLNNRMILFRNSSESFILDEALDQSHFDFNRFENPRTYRYKVQGDFVSNTINDITRPKIKLYRSEYKREWKKYQDDDLKESYPTYILETPDPIYAPESYISVEKDINNNFIAKKKKITTNPLTNPFSLVDLSPQKTWSYSHTTSFGMRWARLVSPKYNLNNIAFSGQFKLFVHQNAVDTETTTWPSYFLRGDIDADQYPTGIRLSKYNSPDIFIPLIRESENKSYLIPSDPDFNLGAKKYQGYSMEIILSLTNNYSHISYEDFFESFDIETLLDFEVTYTSPFLIEDKLFSIDDQELTFLPVNGTIRVGNEIYNISPESSDFTPYSYKVVNQSPQEFYFQKFAWANGSESLFDVLRAELMTPGILVNTTSTDTLYDNYGYFDLLALYKGTTFISKRLDVLKKSILDLFSERDVIYNNLLLAKTDLKNAIEIEEKKILEAQVAALERDYNDYAAVVGNWSTNGENLVEGSRSGRLTIFYEFFLKFFPEYEDEISNNERPSIREIDSIYSKYKKLEKDKANFWYDLKNDYREYLYEGYYENKIEVDPWSLLLQGLKIIKNHQSPSEEYDLTYIDGSQLIQKNIDLIKVGDLIKIKGEKLGVTENESNEIQVSSISRSLRDTSNMQLSVNQVRRADSIIEKLISGLNK